MEGLESQQEQQQQQQRNRVGHMQDGTLLTLHGSGIDLSPCWRHAGALLPKSHPSILVDALECRSDLSCDTG